MFTHVRGNGGTFRLFRADPVREPAVEKGFVGGAALGEAEVAFALERFERAQQDSLAIRAAQGEEGIERGKRLRSAAAVWREVGIVAGVAVERSQRALEKVAATAGPMLAPVSNSSAATCGARWAIASNPGRSQ
jgi:hypothetical protein